MLTETIVDNEYATLWLYSEHKIVHHVFHKFIYGQLFRDVLLTGLDLVQKGQANKWLSDDRKNSALPAEDGEWALKVWSPQVMQAGWKCWAIVMPDKIVGQMNMNRFAKAYIDHGLVVKVHSTPEEALDWLMTF